METPQYLNIPNLKVTVFQAYLFWENVDKNLQNLSLRLSGGVREKTDLIVLPEMFNTGFTMNTDLAEEMDGKTVEWLQKTAKNYDSVVTGSLIIKEKNQYFNRLMWVLPSGDYQYYDKHHLFGMGEEDKYYTAGTSPLTVKLKGWKIRLAVCYDLRFPAWLRNTEEDMYDILLLVASWPDKRISHWRTLIHARAVENQSYVIGVNRVGHDGNQIYHSGHSMCIDPYGNTVYYKPEDEDLYTFSINYPELEKIRRQFPFLQDADKFELK